MVFFIFLQNIVLYSVSPIRYYVIYEFSIQIEKNLIYFMLCTLIEINNKFVAKNKYLGFFYGTMQVVL